MPAIKRRINNKIGNATQQKVVEMVTDIRHGLPEGYQDPYTEGWDDGQVLNEDEGNGEEGGDEDEQETEKDISKNEEAKTEDAKKADEEVLTTNRRRYSPILTPPHSSRKRAELRAAPSTELK